jgi:hypothetical protein
VAEEWVTGRGEPCRAGASVAQAGGAQVLARCGGLPATATGHTSPRGWSEREGPPCLMLGKEGLWGLEHRTESRFVTSVSKCKQVVRVNEATEQSCGEQEMGPPGSR